MANTNKEFKEYNDNLALTKTKRDKMNESREASRTKIKKHFKENHEGYIPKFWIQGSKKNGTNIRTEDDSCDQDDGIYFDRDPDDSVSGTTLMRWIYDASKDDTTEGAEWKKRCVRKKYAENNMGTYHFDYPAYYETEDMDHPQLAVKNEELEESDPKEFSDWFNSQKDADGQLVRIIKYLKGWCSFKGKTHKMPSGLSMTVLASNHIEYVDGRDDKSLYKTLKGIKSELKDEWKCIMPTTPKDDLFERHDQGFQDRFMEALDKFIISAKDALDEDCKHKATKLWKKHLGSRFPIAEKEELKSVSVHNSQVTLANLVGNNKPYYNGKQSLL